MTTNGFINKALSKLGIPYSLFPSKITRTFYCAHCGIEFSWTGSPMDGRPVYCSKGHRDKASKARKNRIENAKRPETVKYVRANLRYSTGTVKACPRPEKERHNSFYEAWNVINRVDKTMHPYTCRCGYIHIGH